MTRTEKYKELREKLETDSIRDKGILVDTICLLADEVKGERHNTETFDMCIDNLQSIYQDL